MINDCTGSSLRNRGCSLGRSSFCQIALIWAKNEFRRLARWILTNTTVSWITRPQANSKTKKHSSTILHPHHSSIRQMMSRILSVTKWGLGKSVVEKRYPKLMVAARRNSFLWKHNTYFAINNYTKRDLRHFLYKNHQQLNPEEKVINTN